MASKPHSRGTTRHPWRHVGGGKGGPLTRFDVRVDYAYHGGEGGMPEDEVQARIAAARATAQARRDQEKTDLAAKIADRTLAGASRCDGPNGCGYTLARCCCPGGPRGGTRPERSKAK